MMEILLKVNLKEMENIFLIMVITILENGKMIWEMEKVFYIIKMEIINMKESIWMIKKMEKENIFSKMGIII